MRGEVAVKATPGVIDSLGEGFGLVNRFLWVALIPVALDVVLWLAPRVTALPLVEQFVAGYREALASLGESPAVVGAADVQTVESFGRTLGQLNLLGLLAWNPVGAAVPSFVAGQLQTGAATLVVTSLDGLLALGVGLQLVGLFLGCVYLGLVGQLVRDGRPSLPRLVVRVGRYWLTFLAYAGLLLGGAIVVSLAIAVLALVPLALAGALSALLTTATVFVGLFLGIYLFFFTAAVVVGERGALDAIRSSFRTVRESFWGSMGLILLTFVIGQGMLVIWSRLAEASWGVLLAIVGNAYVASGLVAASMCFYRNRALRAPGSPAPGVGRSGVFR